MRRLAVITTLILGISAGFLGGWLAARRHFRSTATAEAPPRVVHPTRARDCDQAPDLWQAVRIFEYEPVKTTYLVEWQLCLATFALHRALITQSASTSPLFEYSDDEVLRVETVDLLGKRSSELLVMTASAGTGDYVGWHVLSESHGKLHEWKVPDYDVAAQKLLRADEDFCCKGWNFHLEGRNIVLTEGIYHKGEANCCPSHGGVLVRLTAADERFSLSEVRRLSRKEYYRWKWQPFCLHCFITTGR